MASSLSTTPAQQARIQIIEGLLQSAKANLYGLTIADLRGGCSVMTFVETCSLIDEVIGRLPDILR